MTRLWIAAVALGFVFAILVIVLTSGWPAGEVL
jgi:hypothetical protein